MCAKIRSSAHPPSLTDRSPHRRVDDQVARRPDRGHVGLAEQPVWLHQNRHLPAVPAGSVDYLRSLFEAFCPDEQDVEARSMPAFSLLIGNHFMAADHGRRSRGEVLELAARWLLAKVAAAARRPVAF